MDNPPDRTNLHRREAEFSDEWAQSTPLDEVRVRQYFEAPTALENRHILNCLGPLTGKSILDIGAGLGESSVYFALLGARVTMVDISPEMVALAGRLAEKHGVKINAIVMSAENPERIARVAAQVAPAYPPRQSLDLPAGRAMACLVNGHVRGKI